MLSRFSPDVDFLRIYEREGIVHIEKKFPHSFSAHRYNLVTLSYILLGTGTSLFVYN